MRSWRKKNKEKLKKWIELHKLQIQQSKRKWNKKNRELKAKLQKEYVKRYPKIIKAHRLANQKTFLKSACEICGNVENLERHHWNYDRPLLVNTLCIECHQMQHIKHFGGN